MSGQNIACDLHMEHLNKNNHTLKVKNKLTKPIKHAAQSLGMISSICNNFSMESVVAINKPYHFYPLFIKGFDAIIKELQSAEIFTVIPRPTLKVTVNRK